MRKYRKKIDRLDRRVARLLCRRYRLVRDIGLCKLRQGRQVADPRRELRVLSNVADRAPHQDAAAYVREVYRCIIEASRAVQNQVYRQSEQPHHPPCGPRG